jgi:phosphoglycolate phosphatase
MRTAIFDLDGTLAETAPDLVTALNRTLGDIDIPPVDFEFARRTAGMGSRALIIFGLEAANATWSEQKVAALQPAFLRHYENCLTDETHLYDSVATQLEILVDDNWRLGVCTNKPHVLAITLLEQLGVLAYFHALIGAGALPVRKPDPTHLLETITQAGGQREKAILVGDTLNDVQTARNAGVPIALTSFGYALEPMEELAPDAVFHHYNELIAVLDHLTL